MSPLAPALLAVALLSMPVPRPAVLRLRQLTARAPTTGALAGVTARARSLPRRATATLQRHRGAVPVAATVGGVLVGAAAGPALGLAAGVVLGVTGSLLRTSAAARRTRRDVDGALEALAALTGELRSGQAPDAALRIAAQMPHGGHGLDGRHRPDGGHGRVADGLLVAAATASLGGDVPLALRTAATRHPPRLATVFHRLAAGWQVSEDSGASLAAVLDRVEHDLRADRRHAQQVAAHLAGPRATGILLALLPACGLALGTAMGAHPLTVLAHSVAGQAVLLAGVLLEATGAIWTAHLLGGGATP